MRITHSLTTISSLIFSIFLASCGFSTLVRPQVNAGLEVAKEKHVERQERLNNDYSQFSNEVGPCFYLLEELVNDFSDNDIQLLTQFILDMVEILKSEITDEYRTVLDEMSIDDLKNLIQVNLEIDEESIFDISERRIVIRVMKDIFMNRNEIADLAKNVVRNHFQDSSLFQQLESYFNNLKSCRAQS